MRCVSSLNSSFVKPSSRVFAIARQESAFHPTIVSPANAYGLMQVTAGAGKYVTKKYGASFDELYRPRLVYLREREQRGERYFNNRLPMVCQVCQIPVFYTEPDDPLTQCVRIVEAGGTKHHCCSDGCADIFRREPEKYVQALLPPQQIYRGEAGGARDIWEYAAWLHLEKDVDTGEYRGSPDQRNWAQWQQAHKTKPADAARGT